MNRAQNEVARGTPDASVADATPRRAVAETLKGERKQLYADLRARARFFENRSRLTKLARKPVRFVLSEAAFRLQTVLNTQARTFWGERMALTLPEPVSMFLYRYGYFEEGLTAFFLLTLRDGDCFVDVGSHYGYFTLLARHLIGQSGKVLAFEPTPSTFAVNRTNTARFTNILVENKAAWSEATSIPLTDLGVAWSSHNSLLRPKMVPASVRPNATTYTVECVKLDDYFRAHSIRPRLVKIDAESAELEILRGMSETLRTQRPAVTVEVGDDRASNGELRSAAAVEFCSSFGYTPFAYVDGAIVAHRIRDSYEYDNIFMVPEERVADVFAAAR